MRKKPISTENSADLAYQDMTLAFKETYLLLQRTLIGCVKRAKTGQEKESWKRQIKEVSECYLVVKEKKESFIDNSKIDLDEFKKEMERIDAMGF